MKKEEKGFENTITQLEAILEKMSDEGTPLDEGIELYAKAAKLIQQANETLQKAQLQIEEIDQKLEDWQPAGEDDG